MANLDTVRMFDFETENLRIRPLGACDEELYCEVYSDRETMRFIGPPFSGDRAQRSFRRDLGWSEQLPIDRVILVIVDKATHLPLGVCGISQFDTDRTRAEAGIVLRTGARKRGLAKEILTALVGRVFAALPVEEVWVQYPVDHMASEALVNSVGFPPQVPSTSSDEHVTNRIRSVDRQAWGAIAGTNSHRRRLCPT